MTDNEAEQTAAKNLLTIARSKGAAITKTDRGYLLLFTAQMLVQLLHNALISDGSEGPGICGLVVGPDSEVRGKGEDTAVMIRKTTDGGLN